MKSRRWLLGGGAVLLGGGMTWALRSGGSGGGLLPSDFWSQNWPSPSGQTLDFNVWRGHPLLINFWATWCPPCIDELPLLDQFYQKYHHQGWQVLGLAVDQTPAVHRYLTQHPLSYPIAVAGAQMGLEWSRRLGNDRNGGLPFSVWVSRQGEVRARQLGRLQPHDLELWRLQLA